jgi:hypothetical protein
VVSLQSGQVFMGNSHMGHEPLGYVGWGQDCSLTHPQESETQNSAGLIATADTCRNSAFSGTDLGMSENWVWGPKIPILRVKC